MDRGDYNIPFTFWKKRGDKYFIGILQVLRVSNSLSSRFYKYSLKSAQIPVAQLVEH